MSEKDEQEFEDVEAVPWTQVDPRIVGLDEKILAREGTGAVATRLLRFAPGVSTAVTGVQKHEFWEEVYILDGELHDLSLDAVFTAGSFACRPPGMAHGPWQTETGCLTFEVRYTRTSQ